MYLWSKSRNVKNSYFRIKSCLIDVNMSDLVDIPINNIKYIVNDLESRIFEKEIVKWRSAVNSNTGTRGVGHNKLRLYKLFKTEFGTEAYVKDNIPFLYRSALAKFRCGVAPLRLETGRYENIELGNRTCFHCKNIVEDEIHVLFHCPLYVNIRKSLMDILIETPNCHNMSDTEKLKYIFTDERLLYISAKSCFSILKERRNILYSK